ncbi:MAG: phasin family protein, partial [Alphaproteobacteria bacterium]
EVANRLNQKFLKAVHSYNDELLTFSSTRLKEDIAVSQKLSECKSPEEVVRVYTSFIQTAFRQYTEEATNLMHLYNIFTDETIASAHEMNEQGKKAAVKAKSAG